LGKTHLTWLLTTDLLQVQQRCLGLIDELLGSPAGAFFAKPVDWRGLGLVDYPKVSNLAHAEGVTLF